jgi:hypothetical protein
LATETKLLKMKEVNINNGIKGNNSKCCENCKYHDKITIGCNHQRWNHCVVRDKNGIVTDYMYHEYTEINVEHMKNKNTELDNTNDQHLNIAGVNGSCSFNVTEVKQMYDHLVALFWRSQANGLVEIDSYDRSKLKELLKLPDNYR